MLTHFLHVKFILVILPLGAFFALLNLLGIFKVGHMRFFLISFLFIVCFSTGSRSQSSNDITWVPAPETIRFQPLAATKKDKSELRYGRQFLNIETYVDLLGDRPRQTFRWATQVYSAKAIEDVASPAFSIEANYLDFEFHYVHVIRDGEIVYDENDVRTNIYKQLANNQSTDGLEYLTVQFLIPGVRSGDIIDYSYSTIGNNPAFKDRVYNNFVGAYDADVGTIYHRYSISADRHLDVRLFADLEAPEIREEAGARHYIWNRQNVKAIEAENSTPAWYQQYPNAVLSEFKDWADVVEHLLPLVKLDHASINAVAQLAEELSLKRGYQTEEDQLRRSLSYVRSEIRYLGSQIGRNGYIPEPPEKVLQSGYGDCKDNSQLLIALLRSREMVAWPALVSSEGRHMAGLQGPTPFAFDHMIVYVIADGKEYWVDPAVGLNTQQISSLEPAAYYGEALIIRPGETELRKIDPDNEVFLSKLEAVDYYDLSKAAGHPGTITLERSYRGLLADVIRASIEAIGEENYAKQQLRTRSRYFEDIEISEPIEINKNFVEKRVDVVENYDIADPWKLNEKDYWYFFQRARAFDPFAYAQPIEDRKTPYQLVFPLGYKQTLAFRVPEWSFAEIDLKIERPYHRFWIDQEYKSYALHVTFNYETLMDHVPAAQVNEYLGDLKKIYDKARYGVFYPKAKLPDIELGELEAPPLGLDISTLDLEVGGAGIKIETPE